MMAKKSKQIRFAALIRVSTEQQEKTGESLRTQRSQIEHAVEQEGGRVKTWYGGQEHATPGHEKKELQKLLNDAADKKFDAVMVAHVDRWSRDNEQSRKGLAIFKEHGIRFFVGTIEYNLFDPTQLFYLGMSAEIGQLHASTQNKKSTESRIHRAKRGIPASGRRPYGRTFDRKSGKWSVDKEKQAEIKEIAERYLAGESMAALAKEFGMNHSNLNKTLMRRCGPKWEERFVSKQFNIDETIEHDVPPLLTKRMIEKLHERSSFNRTYTKGEQKHQFLLASHLYCEHCKYLVHTHISHGQRRYRHCPKSLKRMRECPCKLHTLLNADEIEENVMRILFESLGNPKALERAIEEAMPNSGKRNRLWQRYKRLEEELAKHENGRKRLIDFVVSDKVSEKDAADKFDELNAKEAEIKKKLDKLSEQLNHGPSPEAVEEFAKDAASYFKKPRATNARNVAKRREASIDYSAMSYEDKRALLRDIFVGQNAEGNPLGIYIKWIQKGDAKPEYQFRIDGILSSKWKKPWPLEDIAEHHAERKNGEQGVTQCSPY